jgi:tRNA A-37 threonylcarbamoyl transferase component Bud32
MTSRPVPPAPLTPAKAERRPIADAPDASSTVSSAASLSSLDLSPTPPASSLNAQSAQLPRICPKCAGRYPADFRVCPRDATPLEDAPEDADPLVGATLEGSYEITGVLGEGGMGKVYEARHTRLPKKRYAIKILHHELARQPDVVARFQREAEAAAALEHPNVVGVYDVNTSADGRPYIVQELISGEELGKYLDRAGKLAAGDAVPIVRQVCRALGAAHARGIVHRDVKPENVLLLGDPAAPSVKMVDFGISKVAESGEALTKTGMVMGTPAYMAPEQARGDKVDARADIYAVGAILYRAVTGQKPFEGLDPMATLSAVLCEEPPRPRSIAAQIPEGLELLIQRAMAKEPGERPSSMEELEAELSAFERPSAAKTAGGAPTVRAEGDARTLLANDAATLIGGSAVLAARSAKRARPALVLATLLGLGIGFLLLTDGVLAAVRFITDPTRGPSTGEIVLSVVIAGAVFLAPSVLWLRFIVKNVWSSTPRAIETALRAKAALYVGAAVYAVGSLSVRLFEVALRRSPDGVAWPGWTLLVLTLTLGSVAISWFLPKLLAKR